MQFLFGMMMVELIVQATLWTLRIHWWVAKWTFQAAWAGTKSALRLTRRGLAALLAARDAARASRMAALRDEKGAE